MARASEIRNPRETLKRQEREAGLDAGEIGKPWEQSFEPGSQTKGLKSDGIRRGTPMPPAEMLRKHQK